MIKKGKNETEREKQEKLEKEGVREKNERKQKKRKTESEERRTGSISSTTKQYIQCYSSWKRMTMMSM